MHRFTRVIALIVVVGLLAIGCSSDRNEGIMNGDYLANFMLPAGATLESATFYVYVTQPANEVVNLHRVTSDWEEATVTWNSFAGAYDASIEGSFNCDNFGWKSVDITALAQSWLDGTNMNYGLLMDQPEVFFRTATYSSREAVSNRPYVEVVYSMGGVSTTESVEDIGDAYIRQLYGDFNYGALDWLGTGWGAEEYLEKQCLLKFNFERSPMKASIGDFVWEDLNEDGVQDAGEPGIPGVTVYLLDCQDNILGSTITDANGLYSFLYLDPGDYKIAFVAPAGMLPSPQDVGDNAMDSDADPVTGMTMCTTLEAGENDMTWDAGFFDRPVVDCIPCEGKVTELTLRYDGTVANAQIVIETARTGIVFDDVVQPGGIFTIYGNDKKGTLGTEITLYVNGVVNTKIHTSCSQPIGPGLVSGDFMVIEGYSRAGLLPALGEDCGGTPPPPPPDGECEGKVTELTLRYDGSMVDAHIVVGAKRQGIVFDGTVQPGESFSFVGSDRKGTLGTEISVYVNENLNTKIHTSCSQPIGPGLVSGDFTVMAGSSRNGGELPPL
ncbi:MAG: SdrD B-like domain-containing protein [bacterium]|nr:SdrD B-like domain-containing protein [bacterium]